MDPILTSADITFIAPKIDDSTWIQDKSYKFGFRGLESSRSEMSDNDGNVRGTYTIPDLEGKPILVMKMADDPCHVQFVNDQRTLHMERSWLCLDIVQFVIAWVSS